MMSIRLAVITDLHYSGTSNTQHPGRKGKYGALLLKRVLRLLEIESRPDAVLIAGDLIDPSGACDHAARARLDELAGILAKFPVPVIVIPGNHDPVPEVFYDHFPPPGDYVEVKHARIIPFLDPERPGWNAERLPEEMAKFDRARENFQGPLIALQHVPVFPHGTGHSPYGYLNGEAVIRKMHETGCVLSVSGHHHAGSEMVFDGKTSYVSVPALCEAPYSFGIIELGDDGSVRYEAENFQLPEGFEWRDAHTHSPYAYCSIDMEFAAEKELMEMFRLAGCNVTEHTGHLFYSYRDYKGERDWFFKGPGSGFHLNRFPDYRSYFRSAADERFRFGLEIDISHNCELIANAEILAESQVNIGAIHYLDPRMAEPEFKALYFRMIETFGRAGIPILAHPLRLLRRNGIDPESCYGQIVSLLRQYNMAAELNFHHGAYDLDFMSLCLANGVKLSFGSDAHELYYFGLLQPHIRLLRKLGFSGDWRDILK